MATASAATATPGARAGVIRGEDFPDFLLTNFQHVNDDLQGVTSEGLRLYTERSDNGVDTVKHTAFTGFGTMGPSDDDSNIPYAYPVQGFDNSYQTKGFRLGFRYPDRLRRTEQYSLISKIQRAMGTSAKDTIELQAADPWNKAFSVTVPFVCADGMNLVDAARPLENGEGTWSNEETAAALTENSLEAMDINFAAIVNGQNLKRPRRLKSIAVPRALRRKALELQKSNLAPEDALNAVNIYKGEFDVMVQDHFTSATAWFGLGPMGYEHQLYWYWGDRVSTKVWRDGSNPDVTSQRIKYEATQGCDRPHNIRGNAGA